MSYADELVRLLQPLGVYSFREGSFSLGEWQALGSELDCVEEKEIEGQKQTIVATAEEDGLSRMESLFRNRVVSTSLPIRRAAIAAFLRIGGDGFTREALQSCLSACGADCLLEEVGINHVKISFPQVMGEPEGLAVIRSVAEDILPCQLLVEYFFRYCTWGETMEYGFTWGRLSEMSWNEWRHYTEEF